MCRSLAAPYGGTLGSFHAWEITGEAEKASVCELLCRSKLSTPAGTGKHDHRVLRFTGSGLPKRRPQVAWAPAGRKGACCSTACPALGAVGGALKGAIQGEAHLIVLISISPTTRDAQHLLICFLATRESS